MIPLHRAFISGKEKEYIQKVIDEGALSGNGRFTYLCQEFFEKKYGFPKTYLTSSCTDALEMCALLIDLKPGDEIILPSYTFVSTANSFALHGVKLVFCDSESNTPNIDANMIENLVTEKTKAIVVVHYAGIACEMEKIKQIAKKNNLFIIEDAALSLDSYLNDVPLGKWGDLSTFSFHETKNITCGEGGLLAINNKKFLSAAEIIWEKGTNRSAFLRGESDQYEWISKGSSFLPSELTAAFLYAQLENFMMIQQKRVAIWNNYTQSLNKIVQNYFKTPKVAENQKINGSMYYLIFKDKEIALSFTNYMNEHGIKVSSHYRPLHSSKYFKTQYTGKKLVNCEQYNHTLVRLPLYAELSLEDFNKVINRINDFLQKF